MHSITGILIPVLSVCFFNRVGTVPEAKKGGEVAAPIDGLRAHRDLIVRLLVRLFWADGRLSSRQLEAIVAACALVGEPEPARQITRRPRSPRLETLPPALAPTVLAVAAWTATVDGRIHSGSRAVLEDIVERLGLDAETSERMQTLGQRMATRTETPNRAQLEALLRAVARHRSGTREEAPLQRPKDLVLRLGTETTGPAAGRAIR